MSAEAICLFPYFPVTFMVSRLCATVRLKHLMHCYDSTRLPPCPCLHKCSGMWATACGSWVLSFMSESQKSHCCMRRESKTKATGYSQEVFLRWRVLGEGRVTTPDFASCSPSLWPLRVLGTLCSNSCLPAFQDMTQATGEAAQIMLQMLLFYRVSFPVCHLS